MDIVHNYTAICPEQSDSTLSVAASWIGIVTFITTTLGGLTIFYTLYKTFEKAQEDFLEYGQAISLSSKALVADIETMEPMLQRLAHGHQLLGNAMELVIQIRGLASKLDSIIRLNNPNRKGVWKVIGTYRLGRNPDLTSSMKEMQRIVPSLQAMKINLILMRLDEQDQLLYQIAQSMELHTE